MTALVEVLEDRADALDYDLMTFTGRTLDEYMQQGAAGIVALCDFIKHLSTDSALFRTTRDGMHEWSETVKTNMLLADIYDNLTAMRYQFVSSKSKKKPRRPDPYPRPWAKPRKKKIGKDPVKVSKFWKWWDSKKKKKR